MNKTNNSNNCNSTSYISSSYISSSYSSGNSSSNSSSYSSSSSSRSSSSFRVAKAGNATTARLLTGWISRISHAANVLTVMQ